MSTLLPPNPHGLQPLPLRTSSSHQDPLVYIDRESKHIQRKLQLLIDAQSEGLLAGLGRPRPDAALSPSSLGPSSASASTSKSPSTVPVRQPAEEKIGLRAAREGIFTSIYELLKLREEEREVLTLRVDERDDALKDLDGFHSKRTGLEESIWTIQNNRDGQRSRELREEEHQLQAEIHELETRLSQMKARHRLVVSELSQMENTVEAKLSSYKASLSLLESDVRKFLQHPPVKPQLNAKNEAFYSLNPKRRTLGMAQEYWTTEQTKLRSRQEEVDSEIAALEEGGGVWKQVVWEVSGFEKRLRTVMRQSLQTQSQPLAPDGPSGDKASDNLGTGILRDLADTTERVQKHLELAQSKDWRLLVCCIAAELEALREARELLRDAFHIDEDDRHSDVERVKPHGEGEDHGDGDSHPDTEHPLAVDNPEPPADLLRDVEESAKSEDEDDEPDPAWLLPES